MIAVRGLGFQTSCPLGQAQWGSEVSLNLVPFALGVPGRLKTPYCLTAWIFQVLFLARMAEPEHG